MNVKALPEVTAMLLCENIIEDKQGVFSLIRIVDRLRLLVPDETAPSIPKTIADINLFVAMKALDSERGPHRIFLNFVTPSGQEKPIGTSPMVFSEAPDAGLQVQAKLRLEILETGIHWITLHFDGQFLARTMLLVQPVGAADDLSHSSEPNSPSP